MRVSDDGGVFQLLAHGTAGDEGEYELCGSGHGGDCGAEFDVLSRVGVEGVYGAGG